MGTVVSLKDYKKKQSKKKQFNKPSSTNTNVYLKLLILFIVGLVIVNEIKVLMIATYLLIGANAFVFYLIYINRLSINFLGNSYEEVIDNKEYYRVVTATFTHKEPLHILMNMYSLYNLGSVLEPFLGSVRFYISYTILMLAVGYLSAKAHRKHSPYTLCIGASGVLCGLMGIYMVIIYHYMGLAGLRSCISTMVILVLMTFSKRIDSIGHFVGLFVGILYGIILLIL